MPTTRGAATALFFICFSQLMVSAVSTVEVKESDENENKQGRAVTKDCPLDKGFFRFMDTAQCFKLMTEYGNLSWNEGKKLCAQQKPPLKLAHPYNPVSVRSYIVQRYGGKQAFIDAQGNGEYFVWQDNGEIIDTSSPLWINTPYKPSSNRCLILQSSNFATQPNQPYWATNCDLVYDHRFPLCEMVLN